MKNNKGFTLVELLVTTAIFGLVSLAASSFMITGMRTFNRVNRDVQLQYDSQLAMTFLSEYIVDCQSGIAGDNTNKVLYLVNESKDPDNPGHVVHVFRFTDGKIYYGTAAAALSTTDTVAQDLLAENVTDLDIEITGEGGNAQRVSVTMEMERGDKTYRATQVTALRNQPPGASSWNDLWKKLYPETEGTGA